MIRVALAVLLFGASPVTDLASAQVKNVKLRVPAVWNHTQDQGTEVYTSPAKDAQLLVDVGQVHTAGMTGAVCLDKITTGVGGQWEKLSVAGQPSARQMAVDTSDDKQTQVVSVQYVGCNGKTTWSLQFRIDAHKKDKFFPLVDQVVQSVEYTR